VRPSRAELTGDRLAADLLRDQRDHLTSEETSKMVSPGSWLDRASSVALVAVALIMLSLHLYDRARAKADHPPAVTVDNWERLTAMGIPWGGSDEAPLVITEFMDFTCPFCRPMASVIDSVVSTCPNQFRAVFHHFPLRGHRLAVPAAIASECAREQGRFSEMIRSLFAKQDFIESEDWTAFAKDAGIPDLGAYSRCLARPDSDFPQIVAGRRVGEQAGVSGTPTTWVNGEIVTPRSVPEFKELARGHGVKLP
jgi:protein-disulfide isomerase